MFLIRESIVVIASEHNPSILHPSFLHAQHIVPQEWEPLDKPICTPPFSVVKFKNGVIFLVDSGSLQVSQSPGNNDRSEFDIPQCVKKYVEVLPHVPYTALGINFDALVDQNEPEEFLIKKFLRPGKWNDGNQQLKALSLKLVYMREDWRLTVSLEPSSGRKAKQSNKEISVSGNYHLDLRGIDPLQETIDAIKGFYDKRNHFKEIIGSILSIEEK